MNENLSILLHYLSLFSPFTHPPLSLFIINSLFIQSSHQPSFTPCCLVFYSNILSIFLAITHHFIYLSFSSIHPHSSIAHPSIFPPSSISFPPIHLPPPTHLPIATTLIGGELSLDEVQGTGAKERYPQEEQGLALCAFMRGEGGFV